MPQFHMQFLQYQRKIFTILHANIAISKENVAISHANSPIKENVTISQAKVAISKGNVAVSHVSFAICEGSTYTSRNTVHFVSQILKGSSGLYYFSHFSHQNFERNQHCFHPLWISGITQTLAVINLNNCLFNNNCLLPVINVYRCFLWIALMLWTHFIWSLINMDQISK